MLWTSDDTKDEAKKESLTINTQHHTCLVFRTWLKLVDDNLAVVFGHIYHLGKEIIYQLQIRRFMSIKRAAYLKNNLVKMCKMNHTSLLLIFQEALEVVQVHVLFVVAVGDH